MQLEWTKTTNARMWKYADRGTLLTCVSYDKLLAMVTPTLLTLENREIMELSILSEKLSKLDLVPTRKNIVLLVYSLRIFHKHQDLISSKQSKRKEE